MKTINNLDDLIVALINLKSETKIKVSTKSDPKFNKRGRDSKLTLEQKFADLKSKNITKYSTTTGKINFNYQKAIDQFNFKNKITPSNEPPKETWHASFCMNGTIRVHKITQEKYLFMLADEVQEIKSEYLTEQDETVSKSDLIEFLPPIKSSDKPEFPIRMFKLTNILKLECDEFIYEKNQIN